MSSIRHLGGGRSATTPFHGVQGSLPSSRWSTPCRARGGSRRVSGHVHGEFIYATHLTTAPARRPAPNAFAARIVGTTYPRPRGGADVNTLSLTWPRCRRRQATGHCSVVFWRRGSTLGLSRPTGRTSVALRRRARWFECLGGQITLGTNRRGRGAPNARRRSGSSASMISLEPMPRPETPAARVCGEARRRRRCRRGNDQLLRSPPYRDS